MALACDFIYASNTVRFALPEVTIGIMPGAGGTQMLPRAVGERRAKELLLSGRPLVGRGRGTLGHGQPGVRSGRAAERGCRIGRRDRRQRPHLHPAGQAGPCITAFR